MSENKTGRIFSIAIDGPSGAGKSSAAREVAKRLGAIYLDTGAMYRAMALYMLRQGVDPHDAAEVAARAGNANIEVAYENGGQKMLLDGEDVSTAIRENAVSAAASAVSAVPEVRRLLVMRQQQIALTQSVVMDGRDIGTKVLPRAELKVFLTASPEARAMRRFLELKSKGQDVPLDQLTREMAQRDHDDSTRAASPLKAADDAVLIDSSDMTLEQVIDRICGLAAAALEGKS
ncbi:MAG: (d)CMP kinase [Clostridia bacterium]|nr:(d)CMP kinase [Clostridia bacterium]